MRFKFDKNTELLVKTVNLRCDDVRPSKELIITLYLPETLAKLTLDRQALRSYFYNRFYINGQLEIIDVDDSNTTWLFEGCKLLQYCEDVSPSFPVSEYLIYLQFSYTKLSYLNNSYLNNASFFD